MMSRHSSHLLTNGKVSMIESLFNVLTNAIIPLTLVLALVLLLRPVLLKFFGANSTYFTWLVVPLALIGYHLAPLLFNSERQFLANNNIERVLVSSKQALSHINDFNWLAIISAFISCFLLIIAVIEHWQFKRTLLPAAHNISTRIEQSLRSTIAKRRLMLVVSESIESPMIIGLLTPKLVLPSHFLEIYNQEQQQLIVAHEICHFDRNDIYWNLLAFALIALFWFHPLAWLAYIRFRRDQELSCDQTTLARKPLDSRINYSRALLITAQQKQRFAFAHLSFNEYGDKTVMLERITQIKNFKVMGKPAVTVYGVILTALMTSISYAGHVGMQGQTGDQVKHKQAVNDVYPIIRIEPKYPIKAAKEGVEGAVLLKFDVDSEGATKNIRVVAAQPEKVFDDVAITALSKWKYGSKNHATKEGLVVQLDFRMDKNSNQPIHLVERIEVSK